MIDSKTIKDRRPLLVEGSTRVTFTKDDILIEDFIEMRKHHYVFDLNGNVLETNMDCEKSMIEVYEWVYKTALYLIQEEFYANGL